jgi:anaerobic selenocysteine-containing dehydrogenase/Fe-S-cluster-containing dehydrogenase component
MSGAGRRDFLKVLGIGSAVGLTSCSRTAPDALATYAVPPEQMVKGHALWFATTCRECPAGCGALARVREGRVHKVEGNPVHPVNGGGLCARGQAAVQGLYNPDRLRTPLIRDSKGVLRPAAWPDALARFKEGVAQYATAKDAVGVLSDATSGAMEEAIARWLKSVNSVRHLRYEPIAYEGLREANRAMFGEARLPQLRFAEAQAIFVFGADVIETFLSPVGYARGIADARARGARMVYFGSRLSLTSAHADQHVALAPGTEGLAAMALVRELLALGGGTQLAGDARAKLRAAAEPFTSQRAGLDAALVRALAQELKDRPSIAATGGTAASDSRAAATALAVNLLNLATGATNTTVRFDRTAALENAATYADLAVMGRNIEEGTLKALLIVGANPVYSAPAFARSLAKAPFVACLAAHEDETTAAAHVVLPVDSPLECWDDTEPWTGVHSLTQPAMRRVFDTRHAGEILLEAARAPQTSFREFVRMRWRALHRTAGAKDDFEVFWIAALKRGGYWRDVREHRVSWNGQPVEARLKPLLDIAEEPRGLRLETYPSLAHFDGRSANRPWMQELPDPIAQVVWDTWVEMNPKDAERLGVRTGDRVRVRSTHGEIEAGAYVYPGIQPGAVAIPLGQGHTAFGRYATAAGANAFALVDPKPNAITGGIEWSGERVEIDPLRRAHGLVVVAGHDYQENRQIARSRPSDEHSNAHEGHHPELSIYPPHEHQKHRWGMVVDLNACNGCSACVTACYAENNIPVAGKAEVERGREMSWIRVERFFGPGKAESSPFQVDMTVMLCQQCDNAPCESVCPVYAAYHTEEGLNGQVYNRCVGTRYCANNCPYKVRRFNWFPGQFPAPLDWQLNPDVTVRSKGVMEKCTFCVQRIVQGKDRARREGRSLADGEIVPACAQSCPTRAIVFGDLKDPASRVSRLAKDPRRYRVFEELNTRPAVTYLERIRRNRA